MSALFAALAQCSDTMSSGRKAETCSGCLGENKYKLEVLSFEKAWDKIQRDICSEKMDDNVFQSILTNVRTKMVAIFSLFSNKLFWQISLGKSFDIFHVLFMFHVER